ncbi:hypothetical protein [Pinisolibacter aquiterrae]|uniref:hypothetical protein n=1 Tax=Pinisolibacter aquiterrae TaxID=2815579 RepID=UPI001C3E4428|nr:hypothetical protein [Pinisolibacter aquiterrae]MBV5266854.1 hypothetical protein [Pinisolibacter aquiterrae]MCC8234832.1 hypothetical protein [Pinisolibacter aquiterrae]
MARKPASKIEYVLFDVIYEDGSQRSNRRVLKDLTLGDEAEDRIRADLEAQDHVIAERSGRAPLAIKTVRRSA